MGQGVARASLAGLCLVVGLAALAGCSSAPRSTPTPSPSKSSKPHPSPSASPLPTTVTVIAPLGVNFRTGPSTTASAVAVVDQGDTFPVISYTKASGGWWEVRGSTQTGWITADPQYTSTLTFETFSSASASGTPWSVMYSEGWTFDQESSGPVLFTGPAGATVTFTTAGTTSQLPTAATSGEVQSGVSSVEVYGVTAPLVTYSSTAKYEASVELQGEPGLAFLIQGDLPAKGGSATFQLFLETVAFVVPTTPSP